MKTYKKIGWVLGLLIACCTGGGYVFAASVGDAEPNPVAIEKYYDVCDNWAGNKDAMNLDNGQDTGAECTFFEDNNNHSPSLLYGGGSFESSGAGGPIENATYQVRASDFTKITRNGKSASIPSSINLLDPSTNQDIVSGTDSSYATFTSTGSGFDTTIGISHPVFTYTPANLKASGFMLLVELKDDGTPFVVALVNNSVRVASKNGNYGGSGTDGNGHGTVWAYRINKATTPSTADGQPCTAGSTDASCPPATTDTQTTCEANSGGWALAWAACPVLEAANGLTNTLLHTFEDQLSFSVDQLGNTDTPACGANPKNTADCGASSLHQSWSLVRDISTGFVVIIMLIMVFSQAIGSGPFDAYTIRKLLPKLVAAVILTQLSWTLVAWMIDLVNDVARAIADIMYAPFGGASNMGLFNLLAHAKLSTVVLGSIDWAALLVFAALASAFLFTMLGVALTAIIALCFAVLTLVFRKILLIALLVFAPLAILAWILPGTDKYWKLWRENFFKALFMFPIVIAIVAAGRIFAYVVGTQNNSQFLNLVFVMVGFFGPLFILPKTFKWGGAAMTAVGNGMVKAGNKVNEKPKQLLGKRQESWSQLRSGRAAERYAHPEKYNRSVGAKIASTWQKPLDRIKAGDYDPTLGLRNSELRTRQRNRFLSEAEKHEAEGRKEGLERLTRLEENLSEGGIKDAAGNVKFDGGNKDDMYQDFLRVARGQRALKKYYNYDESEIDLHAVMGGGHKNAEVTRRAALDRMIELGADTNWSHIDAEDERIAKSGTADEKATWRKFLNDNKTQVLEKMPDLLKGTSSVSDISAEGLARMHGAGIKRVISKLNAAATDPNKKISTRTGVLETDAEYDERITQSQARLNKFMDTAKEAITNTNTRNLMEQGGLRAIKAFVTTDDAARQYLLNDDPYKMHSDGEDGRNSIRENTALNPTTGKVVYTGDLLLKPIIKTGPTGLVTGIDARGRDNLPPNLRTQLDAVINNNGSFDNTALTRVAQTGGATAPLAPGVLRIQHSNAVAETLPSGPTLVAGSPAMEAFKLQLRSDPGAVQTLAHGIAYDATDPGHLDALRELKTEAETARTAGDLEPAKKYNAFISQVQQSYQQRINDYVAHEVSVGGDAAVARTAAQTMFAPRIVNLENGGTVAPGTPDITKL